MIGLKSAPQLLTKANALAATRNMSAVSGPPTVRMGFVEKIAHGTVMAVGVLAIPAWVLVHIRHYRGME